MFKSIRTYLTRYRAWWSAPDRAYEAAVKLEKATAARIAAKAAYDAAWDRGDMRDVHRLWVPLEMAVRAELTICREMRA